MIRRRKPIERSTTPIPRSRLARSSNGRLRGRSQRALDVLPERARVVDQVWDRDRGRCQAERLVPLIVCGGRLDAHEVIPRSAWPGGELVVDNVMLVCRRHHEWIDAYPEAAHTVGLHGFSWERLRAVDDA